MFVHLHVHSDNSILNGVIKVEKIVKKAKEYGMPAVALTDNGAMYPGYTFFSKCKGEEIKPIFGCQVALAARTRFDKEAKKDEKTSELVLLAKNKQGYLNLIKTVSKSHLEGFYYRARVDKDLLKENAEGIICLSGGEYGEIFRNFLLGNNDKAKEIALEYKEIYGDNFYIEIQRTGVHAQEIVNPKLIELSKETGIPLVATNNVYYEKKEDAEVREVLWAIDSGRLMSDPARRKPESSEEYFRSPEEMEELFKDVPEAIENTVKIAEQVEKFDIGFGKVQPVYPEIPEGKTEESYLKKLVYQGAREKFGELSAEALERIEFELDVVHTMGYDGYFLVVMDIVLWARSVGIQISNRGSAAACVISYSLGITMVDPVRWNLPFARFLSKERPTFPDIDLDIADDRRDEVIEYAKRRYGFESVTNIGALGKLTTKAAIRDVGRVLGIDLKIIDRLSKLVPVKFGKVMSMATCVSSEGASDKDLKFIAENQEAIDEFRQIIASDPIFEKFVKYVKGIENSVRNISTHACGHLITPGPVMDYCPLQIESGSGKRIITQFEGKYLENVGLMKFDFLGLANLSIIQNAVKFIKEFKGEDIDIYKIPEDDPKAFEVLKKGDTTAVFQLESSGMRKYLKELKPETIQEVSAMVALYRPGPIKSIPSFIDRKFGREKIEYLIPELEPILDISYGIPVYQEQVMEAANKIAGYTLGEAYMLIKAIGKKDPVLMASNETKFVDGIVNNTSHPKEVAQKLWNYFLPFADYGFNKAHSAVYAHVAYQTAYLKGNYPTEFAAALMLSDIDNQEKLVRDILDAEARGVKLLTPDINKSDTYFKIEEEGIIRFGIGGLKGVGLKCINSIVDERNKNGEFTSLDDLCSRLDHKACPKGAIESLIKIGAMDSWGTRAGLLQIFEDVYVRSQKLKSTADSGFVDMFASEEKTSVSVTKVPQIDEVDDIEKIQWETAILGIPLTPSLLQKITPYLQTKKYLFLSDVQQKEEKAQVRIFGQIKTKREILTKNGDKMCFVDLIDITGKVSLTFFPKTYVDICDTFNEGNFLAVKGKTQSRNDEIQVLVNEIKVFTDQELSDIWNVWSKKNKKKILAFEEVNEDEKDETEKLEIKVKTTEARRDGEGGSSELMSTAITIDNCPTPTLTAHIEIKDPETSVQEFEVEYKAESEVKPEIQNIQKVIEIYIRKDALIEELQKLNEYLQQNQDSIGYEVYLHLPNHESVRKIKLEGRYAEAIKELVDKSFIEKVYF